MSKRRVNKKNLDYLKNTRVRRPWKSAFTRVFDDPKYKQWRLAVFKRDGFKCQMPKCSGVCKKLNAHHIKKWAQYPELRFVVGNGITLCEICHEAIYGKEENYESVFLNIISPNASSRIYRLKHGLDNE